MVTVFLEERKKKKERSLKLNKYLDIFKLWLPEVHVAFLQLCFLDSVLSTANL